MSVESKINSLITASNTKTGKTDADLTSAVQSLVDGYGGGEGNTDTLTARIDGSITTYSNVTITQARDYSFALCTELVSVDLPEVAHIKSSAFLSCLKLVNINFPKLQAIEYNTFRNCASLAEFITTSNFNSRLDSSVFEGCSSLEKADFYHINTEGIAGYALACDNLVTLIIRNTDAVPIAKTTMFGGKTTKMNKGEGYIYVPASMVGAYKAATNWAKFADQIRAIEDYPDITGG